MIHTVPCCWRRAPSAPSVVNVVGCGVAESGVRAMSAALLRSLLASAGSLSLSLGRLLPSAHHQDSHIRQVRTARRALVGACTDSCARALAARRRPRRPRPSSSTRPFGAHHAVPLRPPRPPLHPRRQTGRLCSRFVRSPVSSLAGSRSAPELTFPSSAPCVSRSRPVGRRLVEDRRRAGARGCVVAASPVSNEVVERES